MPLNRGPGRKKETYRRVHDYVTCLPSIVIWYQPDGSDAFTTEQAKTNSLLTMSPVG